LSRPIIALDGPAGSGKSTVGSQVAARLGWLFVDTGIFYRVAALLALRRGIPLTDEAAVGELVRGIRVEFSDAPADGPGGPRVIVDGDDVTEALRDPSVDRTVSLVAALPTVRLALVGPQRAAVGSRPAVVAGRDIGTVIFPDAALKIYLDASAEERARRRRAQRAGGSGAADLGAVLREIEERDRIDSTRAVAPLKAASDAVYVSTDGLPVEAVVERVLREWRARAREST